jgi:hypothetical protein
LKKGEEERKIEFQKQKREEDKRKLEEYKEKKVYLCYRLLL